MVCDLKFKRAASSLCMVAVGVGGTGVSAVWQAWKLPILVPEVGVGRSNRRSVAAVVSFTGLARPGFGGSGVGSLTERMVLVCVGGGGGGCGPPRGFRAVEGVRQDRLWLYGKVSSPWQRVGVGGSLCSGDCGAVSRP